MAALADASAAALRDSEVAGGPAHRDDTALVGRLAGERRSGLAAVVHEARTLETSGRTALVAVASSTTAHRRLAADGSQEAVPASGARHVVLELRWTDGRGWRVWAVRPGEPAAGSDADGA